MNKEEQLKQLLLRAGMTESANDMRDILYNARKNNNIDSLIKQWEHYFKTGGYRLMPEYLPYEPYAKSV